MNREALNKLSKDELSKKLKDNGLVAFGNKTELVDRLLRASEAPAATIDVDGDGVKKSKKDKKDKKDKQDKKDKKEKKAAAAATPEVRTPATPMHEKEKKDKKEKKEKHKDKDKKKDKKDKHDRDGSPNGAKKPKGDEKEAADFWAEIEDGISQGGRAQALKEVSQDAPASAASGPGAVGGFDAAKAAEQNAQLQAQRQAALEAAAAAEAEAEAARAAELAAANVAAAEAAAAALGPVDEAAAAEIEAEEAAIETDPDRSRTVKLSVSDVELLKGDDSKWLQRVEEMHPSATIALAVADGCWEAEVSSAVPTAAMRAELCLRSMVAALAGSVVEMRVLPEKDEAFGLDVLDIPEAACAVVQPRKLAEQLDVVAALVQEKERVKPRPAASEEQVALGKNLGFAVGQPIEVRYDDAWFHATATGFSQEGTVMVEWLGGGEAELSAVDVRASKRAPSAAPEERPPPPESRLVVFGELRQRTAAKFQVMAAADRKISGHFEERNPPQPSSCLFGFNTVVVALPAGGDHQACARHRSKIASASEALVEVLGKHAFVAGDNDERRRAQALLQMVPKAGPFGDATEIPDDMAEFCSMVRVPTTAVSAVTGPERTNLSRMEDSTGCLAFWLPLGTTVRLRTTGAAASSKSPHAVGAKVKALFEGEYHDAVVVSHTAVKSRIRIAWTFDGTEEVVPVTRLQAKGGGGVSAAGSKRDKWLEYPRVLAILGPEKSRRACALLVMEASESVCQGLWTSDLEESAMEIRDGRPEEEILFGAEGHPHEGSAAELDWLRGPQGLQAQEGVQRAAPCVVQVIGQTIFYVGYPDQRERGREYLRWVCLSRQHAVGPAGIRSGGTLSVTDADMRDDVTVVLLKEVVAVWLRAERLHDIERDTESLLVYDDGGGSSLDSGTRRLLIAGCSEPHRARAERKIEELAKSAPATFQNRERPQLHLPAAAAPTSQQVKRPAEVEAAPEPKKPQVTKSDPKAVLQTIAWPATINAWGSLQKTVWAGHPKLISGWIRVWSKSQDKEYFLRLKDMKTTFELNEVIER